MSLSSPVSSTPQEIAQRLWSFGSAPGQNLMDELTAIQSSDWTESTDRVSGIQEEQDSSLDPTMVIGCSDLGDRRATPDISTQLDDMSPRIETRITSTASATTVPTHQRARSRTTNLPTSAFDRLRILFGDLWHSPLALARHLIQTVQARIRIPRPLQNIQWWLVGVLLGPMARRRMVSQPPCCGGDLEEQNLLLDDTARRAQVQDEANADAEGELAYGTMFTTPTKSSTRKNGRFLGRHRRVACKTRCQHPHRRKHSPWLWLKFSLTLAFAIGAAFKDGPGSLLKAACECPRVDERRKRDTRAFTPV